MPLIDGWLRFQSVAVDSRTFQIGQLEEGVDFFSLDQHEQGEIVSKESEVSLLRWLNEDTSFRGVLLDELALPRDTRSYPEQKYPALPRDWKGTPGDVDLLLVPQDPREAIAIEAKRFKMSITDGEDFPGARPGKRMKQAVDQITGLVNLGFHKAMLMILVPTDARGSMSKNSLCAGSSGKSLMRLVNLATELDLHQNAGILLVTIDQPTSKDFRTLVTVSACLVKPPKGCNQNPHLTERLVDAQNLGW